MTLIILRRTKTRVREFLLATRRACEATALGQHWHNLPEKEGRCQGILRSSSPDSQKAETTYHWRASHYASGKNVLGKEAAAKLKSVALSNNTIKKRIEEMSVDIADQVISGVKDSKSGFSIQLDESTDVTNNAQLLVYVRYTQENAVKTELPLSKKLSGTTKEKDIFEALDNLFKLNKLDWGKLIGCTLYNRWELHQR